MKYFHLYHTLPEENPPFTSYRRVSTEDGPMYYLEHHRQVFIEEQNGFADFAQFNQWYCDEMMHTIFAGE